MLPCLMLQKIVGGWVCACECEYLQRQEESVRSHESGLKGGGETPDTAVLGTELLSSVIEQYKLLTTEPFLALFDFFEATLRHGFF